MYVNVFFSVSLYRNLQLNNSKIRTKFGSNFLKPVTTSKSDSGLATLYLNVTEVGYYQAN